MSIRFYNYPRGGLQIPRYSHLTIKEAKRMGVYEPENLYRDEVITEANFEKLPSFQQTEASRRHSMLQDQTPFEQMRYVLGYHIAHPMYGIDESNIDDIVNAICDYKIDWRIIRYPRIRKLLNETHHKKLLGRSGKTFKWFINPSEEVRKLALEEKESNIFYIDKPTDEELLSVLKYNHNLLYVMDEVTTEMTDKVVELLPNSIRFFKEQTEEMQLSAINSLDMVDSLINPTDKVIEKFNETWGAVLKAKNLTKISHLTRKVAEEHGIEDNYSLYQDELTDELAIELIRRDSNNWFSIKNPSESLTLEVLKHHSVLIATIDNPTREMMNVSIAKIFGNYHVSKMELDQIIPKLDDDMLVDVISKRADIIHLPLNLSEDAQIKILETDDRYFEQFNNPTEKVIELHKENMRQRKIQLSARYGKTNTDETGMSDSE